ncbi:MAG: haloacid dehalogenase [Phormidesmis sp.]
MTEERVSQIMFVALEGLLAVDSERAKEAIARLSEQNVPMIVFGDCDRAELEPIQERLGLGDSFIVESGSAVFTPVDRNSFSPPLGEQDGNYYVHELGCPYVQARAGLRVLANEISHPLKGFGDFTVQQLERMMTLSEDEAHRAKAREFSEPFMTPQSADLDELKQAASGMGFNVILKETVKSRFSYLVGAGASLEAAVRSLVSAYQTQANEADLAVTGISSEVAELQVLARASAGSNWSGLLISEEQTDSIELPKNTKVVVCDRLADWLIAKGS